MHDHEDHDLNYKASFSLAAWKKVLPFFKPYKKHFIWIFVLSVVIAVTDIIFPMFQLWLMNNVIQPKAADGTILPPTLDGMWSFGVLYVVVAAVQAALVVILVRIVTPVEVKINQDIRNALFYKFQNLHVAYFNDKSVGYLVAKTISDSERIGVMTWRVFGMVYAAIFLLGIFIPMFYYSWELALVLLLLIPIAFGVGLLFQRRLLRLNRQIRKANSQVAGALNEGITGAKTSKTVVAADVLSREFIALTGKQYRHAGKFNKLHSVYLAFLGLIAPMATAAIITIGGYLSGINPEMNLGVIALFLGYAFSLFWPINVLSAGIVNTIANQANAERIGTILDAPIENPDRPDVLETYGDSYAPKRENWEPMDGRIEFINVSFKYPDGNTWILKDFNLVIPANTSLAVVGETGAGKTTLVNLLCRFYEPTEGQILIDGIDYRERSRAWLYDKLGYVLQTPHLFSGTIRDNIKYANFEATEEEIAAAARLAACDNFIEKIEKGYDSEVGESGDKLSTGQKQLISFARAIAADPRLFILDEATANIDTDTEHLIQSAISETLKDRTSVLIAHRLSTIKNSDNIIVLEDGGILEQGTHGELIKQKGRYFGLYSKLSEIENAERIFRGDEPGVKGY